MVVSHLPQDLVASGSIYFFRRSEVQETGSSVAECFGFKILTSFPCFTRFLAWEDLKGTREQQAPMVYGETLKQAAVMGAECVTTHKQYDSCVLREGKVSERVAGTEGGRERQFCVAWLHTVTFSSSHLPEGSR